MEDLENIIEELREDIISLRAEIGDLREIIAKQESEISEVSWRVGALEEDNGG